MAEFFDALTDDHCAFIARQPVFFVATAAQDARINLSPKGMDCFRVLQDKRVFFYPGSSIGNFTPEEAVGFLERVRALMALLPDARLAVQARGRGNSDDVFYREHLGVGDAAMLKEVLAERSAIVVSASVSYAVAWPPTGAVTTCGRGRSRSPDRSSGTRTCVVSSRNERR